MLMRSLAALAACVLLLCGLAARADTTTYSPATTPIVSGAWTDLGTGPLLVENHGSQPFMLREGATQPSASAVGVELGSQDRLLLPGVGHIWARATVDGSTVTANVTPATMGGLWKPPAIVATIAAGQTASGAIDLGGARLGAITTPSTLTATALTFLASPDCSTYSALYDSAGTQVSWTVSTSRYVANASLSQWLSVRCFKIAIASSEGADRAFMIEAVP